MMTTANWCVLAAIMLPYICFGVARNRARRFRDNRNPRDFPNQIKGLPKRAWDAQLNSFENLPAFAAAVIIAQLAHAPQTRVDILALVWMFARIMYVLFYLTDRDKLRTAMQVFSFACVLGLFVVAGMG